MLYELIASSEQRQRSNRWRAYDVIRRKGQQHMTMSDERRGHQSTAYKKGGLLYDMTCVRGAAGRRMEQWTFWLLQKKNRGGLAEREWMKVRWEWEDDDDAMSVDAAAQINWCKTSYLFIIQYQYCVQPLGMCTYLPHVQKKAKKGLDVWFLVVSYRILVQSGTGTVYSRIEANVRHWSSKASRWISWVCPSLVNVSK